MASIKEILAAKAAAGKGTAVLLANTLPGDTEKQANPESQKDIAVTEDKPTAPKEEKSQDIVNAEVAVAQPPKPLTFAEKMALKKQQDLAKASAQAVANTTAVTTVPPVQMTESTTTIDNGKSTIPEADAKELAQAAMPVTEQPSMEGVSAEDAQAYEDIRVKIDTLTTLDGEPLENAMSDLKKALLKNPNATNLMQDQDIGQLVIALRKITGEAIAEAAKDGRKTRVKASKVQVDLTDPTVVAGIMDQL